MHKLKNELDLDFRCWLSHIDGDLDELADLAEKLETARGDGYDSMLVDADEIIDDILGDLASAIRHTLVEYFDLLPF